VISPNVFSRILESYGATIWPTQLVFYAVAAGLVLWMSVKPGRAATIFLKAFLALSFVWVGVFWYMVLAGGMGGGSGMNYAFGALFIVMAALLVVDVFRGRMSFSLPPSGFRKFASIVFAALVFAYPWIGLALGHRFAAILFPGTFPCPTVALGLLVVSTAFPRVDKILSIMLLFLGVPFTPFYQILTYHVWEDFVLLSVGVCFLVLLVKYWNAKAVSGEGASVKQAPRGPGAGEKDA
jgi:hypothetical protein